MASGPVVVCEGGGEAPPTRRARAPRRLPPLPAAIPGRRPASASTPQHRPAPDHATRSIRTAMHYMPAHPSRRNAPTAATPRSFLNRSRIGLDAGQDRVATARAAPSAKPLTAPQSIHASLGSSFTTLVDSPAPGPLPPTRPAHVVGPSTRITPVRPPLSRSMVVRTGVIWERRGRRARNRPARRQMIVAVPSARLGVGAERIFASPGNPVRRKRACQPPIATVPSLGPPGPSAFEPICGGHRSIIGSDARVGLPGMVRTGRTRGRRAGLRRRRGGLPKIGGERPPDPVRCRPDQRTIRRVNHRASAFEPPTSCTRSVRRVRGRDVDEIGRSNPCQSIVYPPEPSEALSR